MGALTRHDHRRARGRSLRAPRALLILMLALTCAACRSVWEPLAGGPGGTEPDAQAATLLRIAVCWPGTPLAEELSAALSASAPGLAVRLTRGDTPSPEELLAAGEADLAIVAVPSEGAGAPELPDAWAAYQPTHLACDALGVVAHTSSPLRALSSEQLQRIYAGYVLDWGELQAGSGELQWVSPQTDTVSRALLERGMLGGETLSSATVVAPNDRAVVAYVAQHPRAIGVASVAALDETSRSVALDGLAPTPERIASGEYPHTWALIALVSPQAPEQATAWLEFARSAPGQDIIALRYALPR